MLEGKVFWITGSSSGLGKAFAREVVAAGARVALTARRKEILEQMVAELGGEQKAIAVAGDVTDLNQMKAAVDLIEQRFGVIDVVVANAGTHIPTKSSSFDVSEYKHLMAINYFGALNCFEAVLPQMMKRRSGHLVGVSSIAGYRGLPGAAAYGATKAALSHFLESIRFDLLPHQVDVTVVNPGFIKTPLTDQNEFPMPFLMPAEEAARVMLKGIAAKKLEVVFPWQFCWFLKFLRILPIPVYHWIIRKYVAPNKEASL